MRTDILYRIASKKVGSPKKLIPLFQEKLAAELGTTRRTIDAVAGSTRAWTSERCSRNASAA